MPYEMRLRWEAVKYYAWPERTKSRHCIGGAFCNTCDQEGGAYLNQAAISLRRVKFESPSKESFSTKVI